MVDRVVFFSGGLSSYFTALAVAEKHGTDGLRLLFTDTNYEHPDLYRFLVEAAQDVGGELVWLKNDGKNIWDIFYETRMLGNTRADPCSRILKREPATKWVKENYPDPDGVILYIGMNFDEEGRWERSKRFWNPYRVESPLLDMPIMRRHEMLAGCRARGIEPPELYEYGFPHNNCGGFCVKAGMAQFRLLLNELPEKYAEEEAKEEAFRAWIDKNVSVMRDRKGGESTPLTMREFREQIQSDGQTQLFSWGGCGCFSDISDEEVENA